MVKTISDEEYKELQELKLEDREFKKHIIKSFKQISEGKLIPV
jgi:hypothetical protein